MYTENLVGAKQWAPYHEEALAALNSITVILRSRAKCYLRDPLL